MACILQPYATSAHSTAVHTTDAFYSCAYFRCILHLRILQLCILKPTGRMRLSGSTAGCCVWEGGGWPGGAPSSSCAEQLPVMVIRLGGCRGPQGLLFSQLLYTNTGPLTVPLKHSLPSLLFNHMSTVSHDPPQPTFSKKNNCAFCILFQRGKRDACHSLLFDF